MTQGAAAASLGVPRSAISLMEAGRRRVSSVELSRLADLYGRPLRWFVNPEPLSEREDAILALFRAAPNLDDGEAQAQVSRCLRLFRTGASLRRILGHSTWGSVPRYELPTPRSVGEALAQGRDVAEQERHRLHLGVAPLRLPGALAGSGIWSAALFLPNSISGFFLNSPEFGKAIAVNLQHTAVRRRSAYAHEYGHALMDGALPAHVSGRRNHRERSDERASAFAAAFLMPEPGVRDLLRSVGKAGPARAVDAALDAMTGNGIRGLVRSPGSREIAWTDVARLARHFGVSYKTAAWRLTSLQITTTRHTQRLLDRKDVADQAMRAIRTRFESEDMPEALLAKHGDQELEVQVLHLALEAWCRDEISSGRFREIGCLLDIDEDALRGLAA